MAQYGKPEYWEDRYQKDKEPFDWYQGYSGIKDIVSQYIQPTFQILNISCGNSRLSEEMYEDGCQHITNIDISFTVLKQMQEMYKENIPNLPFEQMDVRSLQYDDGTFDAVVDKGTFDSILCGDGSGPNADQMLSEIYSVLSPTGVYICNSYGLPDQSLGYFNKPEFYWTVFNHQIYKPTISTSAVVADEDKNEKNFHYMYVLRKQVQPKVK